MVENSEKKEKGEETKKTVLDEVLKELKQPPETPEISRKKYDEKAGVSSSSAAAAASGYGKRKQGQKRQNWKKPFFSEGKEEERPPRPPEQKKTIKEWEPEKAVKKLFLPPGSFVKGTLLAGVDAPASVSAQQTPYPVLVRLTDYAVLPNDFITDIRACVIVGSAYGDISSERVYIRSESLACIREDEELFSVNIDLKADAVGEDGKLGLRGKVVSKEGQMIGRAIISGFISGISDVLRSATRVTWYPLADWEEDVHRPSMGESFQAAGLGGIGKAADLLAKYYIDMMKRIYPVIEIEAGREITFVIIPPGAVLENENYYEIAR